MKKYNITVNGNAYEVEVDEIGGVPSVVPFQAAAPAPAPAAPAPAAAAPAAAAPAAAPAPAPAPAATGETVNIDSPMPGTIMDLRKRPGDPVAAEECVLILEAMKMENEIVSPRAGVIGTIAVNKGTPVNAGDFMFSIVQCC